MGAVQVALAHDYLTQRGGAERVTLALVHAFPGAPLYTSLYDPAGTFPEFERVELRTLPLNRSRTLRKHHRLAVPLLARSFSGLRIDADVTVCSSSGWAHGARTSGRKVVYCHTPARWLYQGNRYLGSSGLGARTAQALLRKSLRRWDQRAAASANRYLANSTWVAREIERIYGIAAEVVPPPVTLVPGGPHPRPQELEPGFVLCVSRLLPYKNVDVAIEAMGRLGAGERLVIVGEGPDEARLRGLAGANVSFAGKIGDAELRWLYENARCLVASSYEDFGLTPIEAAAFGKPTAALRFGGFLDTIVEGETGILFDRPAAEEIASALREMLGRQWDAEALRAHAGLFSEERFARRLQEIVDDELHGDSR